MGVPRWPPWGHADWQKASRHPMGPALSREAELPLGQVGRGQAARLACRGPSSSRKPEGGWGALPRAAGGVFKDSDVAAVGTVPPGVTLLKPGAGPAPCHRASSRVRLTFSSFVNTQAACTHVDN